VFTNATLVVLSLLQARPTARQYTIAYTIAMPDVGSHLYSITLSASGLTGGTVDLQMPVWSPGRYGRMDFAKNVQELSVSGSDGKPLRWTKLDGSLWRVFPAGSRSLRVSYRVFANAPMSGTFSVLDSAHANWNGASPAATACPHDVSIILSSAGDARSISHQRSAVWACRSRSTSHHPRGGRS